MGNNSGEKSKKYGEAGTKRGRFNANPVRCNHPSCMVARQAKEDREHYAKTPRLAKTFVSKAISHFSIKGS